MKRRKEFVRPLLNPLTGKQQYGGAMWDYREVEPGVVEVCVTFTTERWKLESGVPMRQECNGFLDGPWRRVDTDYPVEIQVFLARFARGQRLDGTPR